MNKIGKSVKIYQGVKIGKNSIIEDFVVLGVPPPGVEAQNVVSLQIGEGARIRPFSVIYAGNSIGENFETGQGVTIRENNIIGNNVRIGSNTYIRFGNRIGDNTRVHANCFLELTQLEEYVFVGPGTIFLDDPHPMKCPKWSECLRGAKVKKYAKIGGGCIILPGVTIGEHALVGAGACVTKDVQDYMVVVGHPAKPTKRIDQLKCYTGYFERPYIWAPYKRDKDKSIMLP